MTSYSNCRACGAHKKADDPCARCARVRGEPNFDRCERCGKFHAKGWLDGNCAPQTPTPPVHYAHCMSRVGQAGEFKCTCPVRDHAPASLEPDDLLTARVFATPAGKVFLAYADSQPYGAALRADVSTRVARCETYWNTKP